MADTMPEREINKILRVAETGGWTSTGVSLVREVRVLDGGTQYERIEVIEPGCYFVTESAYMTTIHRVTLAMTLTEMEAE